MGWLAIDGLHVRPDVGNCLGPLLKRWLEASYGQLELDAHLRLHYGDVVEMDRGWDATPNSKTRSAESTTGRFVSVWGLIGEITNACMSLRRIGPPTERLWAVDPTGVLIIRPSQL